MADDSFWRQEVLFLRRELNNKLNTIDKLFNILPNNNHEITKQFFLSNNSAEKASENVMTINSVFNIDNRSSTASSTKHQSTLTANTSETLIITEDISDKKVKKLRK